MGEKGRAASWGLGPDCSDAGVEVESQGTWLRPQGNRPRRPPLWGPGREQEGEGGIGGRGKSWGGAVQSMAIWEGSGPAMGNNSP